MARSRPLAVLIAAVAAYAALFLAVAGYLNRWSIRLSAADWHLLLVTWLWILFLLVTAPVALVAASATWRLLSSSSAWVPARPKGSRRPRDGRERRPLLRRPLRDEKELALQAASAPTTAQVAGVARAEALAEGASPPGRETQGPRGIACPSCRTSLPADATSCWCGEPVGEAAKEAAK